MRSGKNAKWVDVMAATDRNIEKAFEKTLCKTYQMCRKRFPRKNDHSEIRAYSSGRKKRNNCICLCKCHGTRGKRIKETNANYKHTNAIIMDVDIRTDAIVNLLIFQSNGNGVPITSLFRRCFTSAWNSDCESTELNEVCTNADIFPYQLCSPWDLLGFYSSRIEFFLVSFLRLAWELNQDSAKIWQSIRPLQKQSKIA